MFNQSLLVFITSLSAYTLAANAAGPAPDAGLPKISAKQIFKDNDSPCRPFRLACTAAGFTLDHGQKGNRLIADCITPLVEGRSVTNPTTLRVVETPVGSHPKACKANIHHGPARPTTGMNPKPAHKASGTKG